MAKRRDKIKELLKRSAWWRGGRHQADLSSPLSSTNLRPTEATQETTSSIHESRADGQALPMQAPKTTGPAKDSASHQPNNAVSSEIGQSTSVVNHLALQNPHNAQRGEAGASSADLAASTQTGAMLLDQSEALSRNASNDHVNAILPTNHMNGPTSLWDEAYSEVYQRDKTLMAWFEDFLWSSQTSVRGPTAGNEGKERQIQKLVEEKSMILQENRTRFSCWGHTVVVRDQFMNAIDLMLKFKGIIDVAIQANSAAALAWSGGVVVLQLVQNIFQDNKKALDGLSKISRILVYFKIVEQKFLGYLEKSEGEYKESLYFIRAEIVELYTEIYYYQIRFLYQYSRRKPGHFIRAAIGSSDWKDSLVTIQEKEDAISKTLSTIDSSKLEDMSRIFKDCLRSINEGMNRLLEAEEHKRIQELPFVANATFVLKSTSDDMSDRCLEGTQTEVLEIIQNWYKDHDGVTIFWLSAQAGTGKSTVARTVATALLLGSTSENTPLNVFLGATFFFSQGDDNRNSAHKLVTTISRCLARVHAKLRDSIAEAAGQKDNIESGLRVQWESLVAGPLREFGKTLQQPTTLVIIIDALDECNFTGHSKVHELRQLLELLSREGSHSQGHLKLRFLITSRPERHIEEAFEFLNIKPQFQMGKVALQFTDSGKQQHSTEDDITLVLRHKLKDIAARRIREDAQWPGEEMIRRLSQKSQGLYIYAATCWRFLDAPTCKTRLEYVLGDSVDAGGRTPQSELDALYTQVLEASIQGWTDAEKKSFRSVMGPILLLAKPVSVSVLTQLIPQREGRKAFGNSEHLRVALADLHSVIQVPEDDQTPITLLHLSFRDFLLNEARCIKGDLRPDVEDLPKHLFQRCIEIMHHDLAGPDLCHVQRPGFTVDQMPPSEVRKHIALHTQYACNYWVFHLDQCRREGALNTAVGGFLKARYLFWLEALSWMGEMEGAVAMLRKLRDLFRLNEEGIRAQQDAVDDMLTTFIDDAYRFFLNNRVIIEKAPLQIYSTALVFSPSQSIVRNAFSNHIPSWITRLPRVPDKWSRLLFILGAGKEIKFLRFSPVKNEIVVRIGGRPIEIYDTETGFRVSSLDFPDVRDDQDAQDSDPQDSDPQDSDSKAADLYGICDVDFSLDGTELASIDESGKLCIWKLQTGERRAVVQLFDTPYDREEMQNRVAFSPIGDIAAAFSREYHAHGRTLNFRMWNITQKSIIWSHEFDLPPEDEPPETLPFAALRFSPNGRYIAVIHSGLSPLVIDVHGRFVKAKLETLVDGIFEWSWAPNSNSLATVKEDVLQIWNISTEKAELQVSCNTVCNIESGSFTSVRFCSNGAELALGVGSSDWSQSGEILFLNASTLGKLQSLSLGGISPWFMEFSARGSTLVTADVRGVAVWDVTDLSAIGYETEHMSAAISPDWLPVDYMYHMQYCSSQDYLISRREHHSWDLWNVASGLRIQWPSRQDVREAGFSPDGKLLFLSNGKSISLWRCQSVSGSFEEVKSFAGFRTAVFSVESSMIALGSPRAVEIFSLSCWENRVEVTRVSRLKFNGHKKFLFFYPWKTRRVIAWHAKVESSMRYDGDSELDRDALCLLNWPIGQVAQLNLSIVSDGDSRAVWFSGNGRLVMYLSQDETWHIREVVGSGFLELQAKMATIWTPNFSDNLRVVSFSDGIATLISSGEASGNKIRLWRTDTDFHEVSVQTSLGEDVIGLGMSSNGAIFYAATRVNLVYAIEGRTGKVLGEVPNCPGVVTPCGYNEWEMQVLQVLDACHHTYTPNMFTKASSDSDGVSSPLTSTGPANQCHQLWVNGEWIAQGSENIFWLPETFRGCNLSAKKDLIALGQTNGYVTFLGIDHMRTPVSRKVQPGDHCVLCDAEIESSEPASEEYGRGFGWVDDTVDEDMIIWDDQEGQEESEEEESEEEESEEESEEETIHYTQRGRRHYWFQ